MKQKSTAKYNYFLVIFLIVNLVFFGFNISVAIKNKHNYQQINSISKEQLKTNKEQLELNKEQLKLARVEYCIGEQIAASHCTVDVQRCKKLLGDQ
jgi:hypothetical protein